MKKKKKGGGDIKYFRNVVGQASGKSGIVIAQARSGGRYFYLFFPCLENFVKKTPFLSAATLTAYHMWCCSTRFKTTTSSAFLVDIDRICIFIFHFGFFMLLHKHQGGEGKEDKLPVLEIGLRGVLKDPSGYPNPSYSFIPQIVIASVCDEWMSCNCLLIMTYELRLVASWRGVQTIRC